MTWLVNYIKFLRDEWNSYSKKVQMTVAILGFLVLVFFVFAVQILGWGLGYTDMNNIFAWGAWIIGDLGLVALGGGAFFTGFLLYIFRVDKLEPIINSTVLIGLMCYLFTFVFLLFDLGQPLRCWFGFAYPNWGTTLMPASMLTEVFFCLSLYFCILIIEWIPVALKFRILDAIPFLRHFGHFLHDIMWIFAAAGTFLSFFHQGSLGGGMWGVLYGKAGWFRPHFFFLAINAAVAGGTCFMIMWPYIAGKIMKKEVAPFSTFTTLANISGKLWIAYYAFRCYDLYALITKYVPASGRSFTDLWGGYYGIWMLYLEMILCIVPVILLNVKSFREKEKTLVIGAVAGISGIVVSKLHTLLHGFGIPNFPWKDFFHYNPTIQEWGITIGVFALMGLIYMWAIKYLPLFPHLEKQEGKNHH